MSNVVQLKVPTKLKHKLADLTDNRRLAEYLITRGRRWTTSKQINADIGLTGLRVRQLCQAFPSAYVSSANGYKLTFMATTDEKKAAVQSLIRRGQKIVARASALAGTI